MTGPGAREGGAGLPEILKRLDACCVEGDRELDEALVDAFGKRVNGLPVCAGVIGIAAFTNDLEVAMRLAEAALPATKSFVKGSPPSSGWKINLYRGMTPSGERYATWECCIRSHAGAEKWHSAPTAALAVLIALVSALIAHADQGASPAPRPGREGAP